MDPKQASKALWATSYEATLQGLVSRYYVGYARLPALWRETARCSNSSTVAAGVIAAISLVLFSQRSRRGSSSSTSQSINRAAGELQELGPKHRNNSDVNPNREIAAPQTHDDSDSIHDNANHEREREQEREQERE